MRQPRGSSQFPLHPSPCALPGAQPCQLLAVNGMVHTSRVSSLLLPNFCNGHGSRTCFGKSVYRMTILISCMAIFTQWMKAARSRPAPDPQQIHAAPIPLGSAGPPHGKVFAVHPMMFSKPGQRGLHSHGPQELLHHQGEAAEHPGQLQQHQPHWKDTQMCGTHPYRCAFPAWISKPALGFPGSG